MEREFIIDKDNCMVLGLFYHKKNRCWTTGSSAKPQTLTEEEAIVNDVVNAMEEASDQDELVK